MALFRKKPVVVAAVQYGPYTTPSMELMLHMAGQRTHLTTKGLVIETLEGPLTAQIGDWIIKGIQGELYACKPDIFEQTYEKVEDDALEP